MSGGGAEQADRHSGKPGEIWQSLRRHTAPNIYPDLPVSFTISHLQVHTFLIEVNTKNKVFRLRFARLKYYFKQYYVQRNIVVQICRLMFCQVQEGCFLSAK